MFSHLLDFGYRRTPKEAIGFYIVYVIGLSLAAGVATAVGAPLIFDKELTFEDGVKIGSLFAMVAVPILGLLVALKRNPVHITYIMLALISGALAVIGGALLGLIPIAYLTTRPGKTAVPASAPTVSVPPPPSGQGV